VQDIEKYRVSQHRGRVKHPEIRFDCPRGRIVRQEDLDGTENVADQDQSDGDIEGDDYDFDISLPTLLEDAFIGAPEVEDGNSGDEGDVEGELHDQTGLEKGEAGADGVVGGFGRKEGGGALSGEGEDSSEEANGDEVETLGADWGKREVGRYKGKKKEV
jgi:hypothetical protein